jgi:hypothetical protein
MLFLGLAVALSWITYVGAVLVFVRRSRSISVVAFWAFVFVRRNIDSVDTCAMGAGGHVDLNRFAIESYVDLPSFE